MLQNLPSRISYSAIDVSLPSTSREGEGEGGGKGRVQRLLRRDLFDARFQMLIDEEEDEATDNGTAQKSTRQQMVDGKVDAHSDLVPGVYEGGLKTWECALDLVETLDALHSTASHNDSSRSTWSHRLSGKHILELGCGTSLPSVFLLDQVLRDDPSTQPINLNLHLADYNAQVLQLVTLPNLILAWYASPAASHYRSTTEATHLVHERNELVRRGQDHFHAEDELAITDQLVAAFDESLKSRGIQLNFYSGAWSNFPSSLFGDGGVHKMDIILTSETIYSLHSLPALVELLSRYTQTEAQHQPALVLVAAKVIYFGVGGGVESFKQTLAEMHPSATVEPIHSVTKGVGRTVLSVTF